MQVKSNQDIDLELKRKRQQVRVLDALITERAHYQREQELVITAMVEAGNTELMGLNHEILVARQVLKDLKTEIRTSRQDKRLMEEDLDQLRVQITTLSGPGFNMGIVQAG